MFGFRDSEIKLFGKTISLPKQEKVLFIDTSKSTSASVSLHEQHCSDHDTIPKDICSKGPNEVHDEDEKPSERENTNQENCSNHQVSGDLKHPTTSSGLCENPKMLPVNKETSSPESPKNGEQGETSNSDEKTLKKPDRIIPCPRCNSMDTKFCYYNNYNVNQPRHFCKNCQRYWTAGGTMRNVPVGAGRRKNKHSSSASHYRHILVSEALQTARANAAHGLHRPTLVNNGTVLNSNRFLEGKAIGDDQSSNSNTVASNSTENGLNNAGSQELLIAKNFQGFPVQVPCFAGPPWSPGFCPPGYPVSICRPPTYWGCTLQGSWSIPWLAPPPNSPNHSFVSTSRSSPTLGKHSRDVNILNSSCNSEKEELSKEINSERGVWIPKTLRIDDPSEAANSSMWATLGNKNEKSSSKNGGGLFKSFQSKGDQEENHIADTLSVLQANPAAMSRSLNFHETT